MFTMCLLVNFTVSCLGCFFNLFTLCCDLTLVCVLQLSLFSFSMVDNTQPWTDLQKVLQLVSGFSSQLSDLKTSTETMISRVNECINTLEKDLAESETASQHGHSNTTSHENGSATEINPTGSLLSKFTSDSIVSPSTIPSSPLKRNFHKIDDNFSKNDEDLSSISSKKRKHKKSKKSKDFSFSSSDSAEDSELDVQMEELMDEYKATKPKYLEDPTTTPIQDCLAKMLETWFWTVYSKEEVRTELAKSLQPENAAALIPTRINEAIFRSLSAQALSKDMPSCFVQNAFMKASQPFAVIWSTLIALENFCKSHKMSCSTKFSETLSIDFQFLRNKWIRDCVY